MHRFNILLFILMLSVLVMDIVCLHAKVNPNYLVLISKDICLVLFSLIVIFKDKEIKRLKKDDIDLNVFK